MIREAELRVLAEVREPATVSELADRVGRSRNHVSEVVADLSEKGLVRKERVGRSKRVAPTESKAVELYHEITQRLGHVDPPKLLSGPAVPLLYYLDEPITVADLAERTGNYRNTVHRRVKRMLDRGILRKADSRYRLTDEFRILHEFAAEYVHHVHRRRAGEAAGAFTILWENHEAFLVRTDEEVTDDDFRPTGPERFQDYGIPLLATEARYYVFPADRIDVTAEELVCHMLLIDSGTRYQSYCLLVLSGTEIDEELLGERSEVYGVAEQVDQLLAYLESRGETTTETLPSWREFRDLADDYGVTA